MRSDSQPQVVAVINSNDDVLELLRIVLEQAGFAVVTTHIDAIKRAAIDFEQFIRQHGPAAIVYDVPPPYERQWQFLQHIRAMPFVSGTPFVLTTTNVAQVQRAVGAQESFCEIIGKPYDLDRIVDAVRKAVKVPDAAPSRP